MVELCGISEQELSRFKQSSNFADAKGKTAQPSLGSEGPHMTNYPEGVYEAVLGVSDETVWANSENVPPVAVGSD